MVPSAYVRLESFPRTAHGKLDLKALPDPEFKGGHQYVAPLTDQEHALCVLWQKTLNVPRVGLTDDFFELGGDSIVSIGLAHRMSELLGAHVSVADIFVHRTLEALLSSGLTLRVQTQVEAEQGPLQGAFSLLPIQQDFFGHNWPVLNHWNQSFLLRVPELQEDGLQRICTALMDQHDMLRATFRCTQGHWEQVYQSEGLPPSVHRLDVRGRSEQDLQDTLTQWQSDFCLEQGPLWQLGYLYGYPDGSARLFMALHHLIVDAVSWRILAEDCKRVGQGLPLGPKTSSTRQWVRAVQNYASAHQAQVGDWEAVLHQLSCAPKKWELGERATQRSTCQVTLSQEQTRLLLTVAGQAYYADINTLLLTALSHAMSVLGPSGDTEPQTVGVWLEGHGREEIDARLDISRTVGWFTTVFPVALKWQGQWSDSLKTNKEALRAMGRQGPWVRSPEASGPAEQASPDCRPVQLLRAVRH